MRAPWWRPQQMNRPRRPSTPRHRRSMTRARRHETSPLTRARRCERNRAGSFQPGYHHRIAGHRRTPPVLQPEARQAHHINIISTPPSLDVTRPSHASRLATACQVSRLATGLPIYTARPRPSLHELPHNGEPARSKENTAAAARGPQDADADRPEHAKSTAPPPATWDRDDRSATQHALHEVTWERATRDAKSNIPVGQPTHQRGTVGTQ